MQCYLGIDLGAESGRVIAGLWNGKRIRLQELHRFPNGGVRIAGTLRWDLLRLWDEIQKGLAIAARRFGNSIKSIGVDTWGVDFVLLSKNSEILGLPYHYRDTRTHGIMQPSFTKVSREKIFQQSGVQFMEINTLYQLIAMRRQNPDLLDKAACFLMIPDFLNWCLSGKKVCEFTNATTTQFFHPTKRTWSADLLRSFDIPTSIFPRVVDPGTVLGPLRKDLSKQTGLRNVSVIAPATHDTGSAVAAVPVQGRARSFLRASTRDQSKPRTPVRAASPGWAYLSSGTWSLMGIEVPQAQLTTDVLESKLTNEGGVDGTYRLLKNIIGLWLVQQCKRSFDAKGKPRTYEQLVNLASRARPLRSLINPDDPRFLNPADMPTAIQDYCRETSQPVPRSEGEIVRCALESLALRYHTMLQSLEQIAGHRIETIHIVGGGSRNRLLNQFTANACDRRVIAGPVEATVLGNLLMQARADGEISSLEELRSVVRASTETQIYDPESRHEAAWLDARGTFLHLH